MSHRFAYAIRSTTSASPQALFDLVSDGAHWSRWAAPLIPYSTWESLGPAGDGGVGAIRAVGTRRRPFREMVTISEPGRRHGYTILTDGALRDYQAEVVFDEGTDETRVIWRGRYETRWRAVGAAYWLLLRVIIGTLTRKLVAAAERGAG
ncbi:SRPBCC family protein [Mycolicibacter arupensis]|uniref:SRPBCC family protein n=1 Tax=Mycolicibacter arupensis TaxID=342002 RepID=UPI00165F43A3|nr:SRPBCC family protein [Mycolicibacter arupensis]